MAKIEWPAGRYTLTEKAYMARNPGGPHEVLDAGSVVVWDGKPGPHMQPMDDPAKWAVAAANRAGGLGSLDPTAKIDLIQSPDTTLAMLQQENADLRARLLQHVDMSMAPEPLKNEVRSAAAEGSDPPTAPPPPPPLPPPPPPLPPPPPAG